MLGGVSSQKQGREDARAAWKASRPNADVSLLDFCLPLLLHGCAFNKSGCQRVLCGEAGRVMTLKGGGRSDSKVVCCAEATGGGLPWRGGNGWL